MEIYFYLLIFIFGAIIGSFLNVVIYRLHTGRSLDGRSHCMSCSRTLTWIELFPIFSYLILRGRCHGCSSYIPPRYLLVELLTGLLFATTWYVFGHDITYTLLNLVFVSLGIVIVVYDMRHTIILDEMTLGVAITAVLFIVYEMITKHDFLLLFNHVGAGLGAALFFGGLWYISKGRWIGFGDAKLALPLGMIVGLSGVFSMVVLSFWIGAIVSLSLLSIETIMKRGKTSLHFLSVPLTIKSEIPFAPFLILGFLMVHFFHVDIFTITQIFFF